MSARSFKTLRRIALIGITGAAAYLGAHLATRAAGSATAELSATVGALTNKITIDYWKVYDDVQHDLLLKEQEDQAPDVVEEGSDE